MDILVVLRRLEIVPNRGPDAEDVRDVVLCERRLYSSISENGIM